VCLVCFRFCSVSGANASWDTGKKVLQSTHFILARLGMLGPRRLDVDVGQSSDMLLSSSGPSQSEYSDRQPRRLWKGEDGYDSMALYTFCDGDHVPSTQLRGLTGSAGDSRRKSIGENHGHVIDATLFRDPGVQVRLKVTLVLPRCRRP
jgi:hypothetical protein